MAIESRDSKQHGLQGSIACPTICNTCLYFVTCIMVENPHRYSYEVNKCRQGKIFRKRLVYLMKIFVKAIHAAIIHFFYRFFKG